MSPFGILNLKPVVIKDTPIIIKKRKANTLNEGCFEIKLLIDFEANSILITVIITAVYLIQSSFAIPTAIIIEAKGKTKRSIIISPNYLPKLVTL